MEAGRKQHDTADGRETSWRFEAKIKNRWAAASKRWVVKVLRVE